MERLTRKVGNTYAVDMPSSYMHEITAKKKLMKNFKKCCEKLGNLEDLEEKIHPLTLERLVNIILDDANKKEDKKADHIHLLSDDESYKWDELMRLEKEIGVPLDKYVKLIYSPILYIIGFEVETRIVEVENLGIILKEGRIMSNLQSKEDYNDRWLVKNDEMVKWAFITREEAEKRFEEMKNGKNDL